MTPHEAIRALAADARLPYLGLYPALVKKAKPNAVQVEPMGEWGEVVPPVGVWVPLAIGVPGVQATAAADSLVLVGFWAADPSRPFAIITDPAGLEALTVESQGSVTVTAQGDVVVNAQGNVQVTADGNATLTASGTVSISGTSVSLG